MPTGEMGSARRRSAPIALWLVGLVLPLVALVTFLTFQSIGHSASIADANAEVVERARDYQAVSEVIPPMQIARAIREGFARTTELGIDRGNLIEAFGPDLISTLASNTIKFDQALDALDARLGSAVLPGGETVHERLTVLRAEIDAIRAAPAGTISSTDVNATYRALGTLCQQVIDQLPPIHGHGHDHSSNVDADMVERRLRDLTSVLLTAGNYGEYLTSSLTFPTGPARDDTVALHAAHRALFEAYSTTLSPDEAERLDPLRVNLYAIKLPDEPWEGSEQEWMTTAAVLGRHYIDYLSGLGRYSRDFLDREVATMSAAATTSRGEANRVVALTVGTAAVTALLLALVMLAIIRPIRRLGDHAATISQGDLQLDPLDATGPSELRTLTSTVNAMLVTLRGVGRSIDQLAEPAGVAKFDPPGPVGASLRQSFRHLADVTSGLKRSRRFSTAIVDGAADAIWTVDQEGVVTTANLASETITGLTSSEQVGRAITSVVSSLSGQATILTAPADQAATVLVSNSEISVDDDRIRVVIARDISERTRLEERLAYQAHHDALTGLPNRFAVLELLERELGDRTGGSVAVLFIDLDSFKSINDTLGHAAGDIVLADVADAIERRVGRAGTVGRLGGDEFVVIARSDDLSAMTALGRRIITAVEEQVNATSPNASISASVGVAIAEPGTTASDAIRRADSALYQAKRTGKNAVYTFDAELQRQIEREVDIEMALRLAVRDGELSLRMQPIIDLSTGEIVGAEALARWDRGGLHGFIEPNEFIAIAERSSLVLEVDRLMLRAAGERIARWPGDTPHRRLSVNVSGRHLSSRTLLSDVKEMLEVTGADPTMLGIELTESHLLDDTRAATTTLSALRELGIQIAIDDFGTGYSSMNYLRDLPIDVVKIDRSFVARPGDHEFDVTVIRAMVEIGASLGLIVVAEGVETREQLDLVRSLGCDRAQGFFLAEPMEPDDADELIHGSRIILPGASH